jgi:hypothetical protein
VPQFKRRVIPRQEPRTDDALPAQCSHKSGFANRKCEHVAFAKIKTDDFIGGEDVCRLVTTGGVIIALGVARWAIELRVHGGFR